MMAICCFIFSPVWLCGVGAVPAGLMLDSVAMAIWIGSARRQLELELPYGHALCAPHKVCLPQRREAGVSARLFCWDS